MHHLDTVYNLFLLANFDRNFLFFPCHFIQVLLDLEKSSLQLFDQILLVAELAHKNLLALIQFGTVLAQRFHIHYVAFIYFMCHFDLLFFGWEEISQLADIVTTLNIVISQSFFSFLCLNYT